MPRGKVNFFALAARPPSGWAQLSGKKKGGGGPGGVSFWQFFSRPPDCDVSFRQCVDI